MRGDMRGCFLLIAAAAPSIVASNATSTLDGLHWPKLVLGAAAGNASAEPANASLEQSASSTHNDKGRERKSLAERWQRLRAALRAHLVPAGRAAAQGLRSTIWHAQRLLRSATQHAQRLAALLLRALRRTAQSMLDAAVANARRWGVALCQSVRSAFDALAASARRRAQRLVAAVRQRRDALVSSPRRLREAAWRWWRRDLTVSHVLRHSRAGRWYVVLRCRRGATKRQLREAYRRRAKRTHPDKTSDDRANAAFDALRDAYELLADDGRRAAYDRQLEAQNRQEREARRRRRAATRRSILAGLRRLGRACIRLF